MISMDEESIYINIDHHFLSNFHSPDVDISELHNISLEHNDVLFVTASQLYISEFPLYVSFIVKKTVCKNR